MNNGIVLFCRRCDHYLCAIVCMARLSALASLPFPRTVERSNRMMTLCISPSIQTKRHPMKYNTINRLYLIVQCPF